MDALRTIFHFLHVNYGYRPEEIVSLFMLFNQIRLKQGTALIEEGKVCNAIGFLLKGLMISSFINREGERIVTRFIDDQGNRFIFDFDSFTNRIPSTESVTAVEKCVVLMINYENYHDQAIHFPNAQKIMVELTTMILKETNERLHDLHRLTNKERIIKFMKVQGHLYNRVNKADIASYLNMSRNQLTRLMKEL